MARSPYGKELLVRVTIYVFYTMSSLNEGDVHNCRLYVTIEIDTRVCVQVVRIIRITEGFYETTRYIFEAMKSMSFMLASSTPGIRSA